MDQTNAAMLIRRAPKKALPFQGDDTVKRGFIIEDVATDLNFTDGGGKVVFGNELLNKCQHTLLLVGQAYQRRPRGGTI